MNRDLIITTAVVATIVLSCCRTVQNPSQQQQRSGFAMRIESVLPSNWALEENGQEVIIRRKEPITRYTCVAMDAGLFRRTDGLKEYVNANGVTDIYQIRLRRAAKMDVLEYERLKAGNSQIVVTKQTVSPNRIFFEDDALRSFDSRYHELPEYYDGSSSIYLETTLGPYECIYPNAVAQDCESIRQKLDSLFTRYSKDQYRRGVGLGTD